MYTDMQTKSTINIGLSLKAALGSSATGSMSWLVDRGPPATGSMSWFVDRGPPAAGSMSWLVDRDPASPGGGLGSVE